MVYVAVLGVPIISQTFTGPLMGPGVEGNCAIRYNSLSALFPQADKAFTLKSLVTGFGLASKPVLMVMVKLVVPCPDTMLTVAGTVHK